MSPRELAEFINRTDREFGAEAKPEDYARLAADAFCAGDHWAAANYSIYPPRTFSPEPVQAAMRLIPEWSQRSQSAASPKATRQEILPSIEG